MNKLVAALGALVGIGVAAGIATAPGATLDALVYRTGIASLYAAALPVGVTMRTAMALLAGVLAMLIVAGPATLLRWRAGRRGGPKIVNVVRDEDGTVAGEGAPALLPPPLVRRADAHPDAPPRRPIRAAAEFGTPRPIGGESVKPLPEVLIDAVPAGPPAEAPLPADLDQPLAAFDPAAIPEEPLVPSEPLPALARVISMPDRSVRVSEIDEVTVPMSEVAPVAVNGSRPADQPHHAEETISALLARLERGRLARRRAAAMPVLAPASPQGETLDDTLARLRQMAAR